MFTSIRFRLRALFRQRTMERELDDELRFHIECETEKYVQQGDTRTEAHRKARAVFGGVERIKEDTRDSRGIVLIQTIAQDLRYALRGLRIRPGFTAAIVVTLGLGIGTNAAMFGVIDRAMFRPPTYMTNPGRVHRVYARYLRDRTEVADNGASYPRLADFASMTTQFDRVVGVAYRNLVIGPKEDAVEMTIGIVSGGFFGLFNAHPVLGRFFSASDDIAPFGTAVTVLAYPYWQLHYAGKNVIGQSIRIGNGVYTIAGIAPAGFVGTSEDEQPAAYIPLTAFAGLRRPDYVDGYGWTWMDVLVERKDGVSIEAANTDLSLAFVRSWEKQRESDITADPRPGGYPSAFDARARAEAGPLLFSRGPQADERAHVVIWVMGVAIVVLLVACANVTNLLLAHALKRRREIALRLALGVTRRRLLQQLLTESMVLAFLGGAFGLVVAQVGARALRSLFAQANHAGAVVTDGRVVLFVIAVTLGVAILTGIAPALHSLRGDVSSAMKSGSREGSYTKSGLRTGLLLFQGAFSVVLLVGAGLFVRSLINVRTQRMGYDIGPVLYAATTSRGTEPTDAEVDALGERLIRVASSIPGVQSASLTVSVPFWNSEGGGAPILPGVGTAGTLGRFLLQAGSPNYFETTGTRIIRGRGFLDSDRASSPPIVVVSEAMAKTLWPGKDPVGQLMRLDSDTNPMMTVVGVAENMRVEEIAGQPELFYYLPVEQYTKIFGRRKPALFIRMNERADLQIETVRRRLQEVMPGESLIKVVTLESLVANRQRSWDFGAKMFVGFGMLGLALAAIGLYSVLAYMVAQRTHELAIRLALGAEFSDMIRMIVVKGVVFATIGIAIGSAIALAAGRWIEPLLFAQKANDPVIFGAVAAVLLVVAVLATMRPALRAARVDPMASLRSD